MKWLTKGVSGIATLNKELMANDDVANVKALFENWLVEHNY